MASAINIVKELIEHGVYLYLEGTELKFRAKKGVFTDQQKKMVKQNKEAIIDCLLKIQEKESQQNLKVPELKVREQFSNLPLSFAQQRLWFVDRLEGGSTHYNMSGQLILEGVFNELAFNSSLKAILERHEILRTHYIEEGGEARQVIKNNCDLDFAKHDLSNLDDEEKLKSLTIIRETESGLSFDLSQDLMLRIQVITLSETVHLVLFTMHHIASDGWSISIFQNELNALYNAYNIKQKINLPPIKYQYADYAMWQREWLKGEVLDKQLNYWKEQLANIPVVHSLRLDRARPVRQTFSGQLYQISLDKEKCKAIKTLCKDLGVSLFMFMETAFAVLLSRYSNEADIVVGTPTAGRNHQGVEGLIGFFVNTLVLRTDVSPSSSFRELLNKNKQIILDAQENQYLPFEKLVEELSPSRHLSHNSIVQISFGVQNADGGLSGEQIDHIKNEEGASEISSQRELNIPFELKLDIYDMGDSLSMAWIYNKVLFTEKSVSRMAKSYVVLLNSIINSLTSDNIAEKSIELLEMLSKDEKQNILVDWNAKEVNFDHNNCIHDLFEEQVINNPNAIALICNEQELSYGELNCRSNQLAHLLIEEGIKPDAIVALCIERSFEMVIALLAVLKSGGAYVPFDSGHPRSRIEYMLKDSGTSVIITTKDLLNCLSLSQQKVLCLDETETQNKLADNPATNIDKSRQNLHQEHLAYAIYTSGSTGKPKGVLVSHKSACDFLYQAVNDFVKDHINGAVVSSPLAFDATIGSLLVPLCAGKYADLLPEGVEALEHLGKRLASDKEAYLFKVTPSHLDAIYSSGGMTKNPLAKHVLVIAGEPLYSSTVERWLGEFLPSSLFINEYGPTETTVGCTTYSVPKSYISQEDNPATVPIGRHLGDTSLYVLNSHMSLQSIASIGELYVGGTGLARGYLKRASLTAERFVPHPFSEKGGERLYRTGDLARYLSDGNLEFIGRIDNQVKIRGFRIELGEIESQLLHINNIKEAIVLAHTNSDSGKYLVAYIVIEPTDTPQNDSHSGLTSEDKSILIKQFKTELSIALPEYMIPERYIFLELLPLTTNGKVNRKALPQPDNSDFQKEVYVAPRNETDDKLCRLWADLLKVDQVGIEDNFFTLGGHSLLATRLISAIREEFEIELPLRVIFESPTVAEISDNILNQSNIFILPQIEQADRKQPMPLSFSQQRLWFVDQLGEGSVQYNMPGHFLLQGDFNVNAFKLALRSLLDRHEVLRTHFCVVKNEVQQVIKQEYDLPFVIHDLSQLSDEEKELEVKRLTSEENNKAFNLSADLMLRVSLLKLSDTHHLISYTMHHIASDGWSRGILQKELGLLYQAYNQNLANPLVPLRIQYADYAFWQRQFLQGEVLTNAFAYWKGQLENLPTIHGLPLDKARPAKQRFIGKSRLNRFDKELTYKINKFNQKQNTTLFMFMHAVLSVLLFRYSSEEDIVVGSAISGRSHRDIEDLIGFFLNDLVLRGDLSGNPGFDDLLSQYKKKILEAYEYQYVPFEMLVEELKPQRSMSHSPLFQIKLDVQNNEQAELSLPDIDIVDFRDNAHQQTTQSDNEHSVKHDLYINVTEHGEGISLYWLYNTDLFFDETVERLSNQFTVLVNNILDMPERDILSIDLLTKEQEKAILFDGDGNDVSNPENKCIHELFEAQADRYPDKQALVYEDASLTYKELNEEANQLAHYLISQGVTPDSLIALCLERSPDMLVGMLGVLKSGAAYVPLDPKSPQARLDYTLDDSNCLWVLTQSDLLSELSFSDKRILPIDGGLRNSLLSKYPKSNPSMDIRGVTSKHLAYVIYTSGSTGQPKGVMVEHNGLIEYCDYAIKHYYAGHLEGSLVSTSYSFDLTAPSLYLPLLVGGNVRLLPEGNELEKLAKTLSTSKTPRLLRLTPSHLTGIIPFLENTEINCSHVFVIGGEALTANTIIALQQRLPKAQIYNHYGPTESIIGCSLFPVESNYNLAMSNNCPIGQAMTHNQLLVLNEGLRLNPIGVPGELYVGGSGLARGYLNRPKLTAEKFISNPFSPDVGARLYQTGDLVRRLANGNLEFIRRIDHQVKVRGLRIELGEIEQGLLAVEGIRDCAVMVFNGIDPDGSLVAYVVLDKNLTEHAEDETALIQRKSFLVQSFRRALGMHLPEYMVPSIYIFLESLPLAASGKLDSKALPAPEEGDLLKSRYIAPRNEIEVTLCRLWQEVLNLEQIGIEDDFFLIGGHSLLATRLINQIRREFDIEVPLRTLFEHATIKELSQEITAYIIEVNSKMNEKEIMGSDDVEEVELE